LVVILAIAAFLICEVYSLDIWWQIAIGDDILDTGSIPRVDRYSVAGSGRPYHDSHWLFQVVIALGHRLLGWVGVQGVTIGLWAVILLLCFRSIRKWVGQLPAWLLLFVTAMASVERFLPRPEIVTFLGLAAFYFLMQRGRYRRARDLAVLAALQILWVNGHGLFVFGPFVVGCYWAEAALARLRGRTSELATLSRTLAVVGLATLVNPYGWGAWRYAGLLFVEARSEGLEVFRSLGELSPTFGEAFRSAPAFWFFALILGAALAGCAAAIVRRRVSPRLFIVLGLALAALAGRRNVVLFCLVAAPFVAETLGHLVPARRARPRWLEGVCAGLIAAWMLYPLSGAYYVGMEIPARFGFGVTPSFFPHGLPSFLAESEWEGQVLNSNTLGGFYLYHAYPHHLPLTDGRWEVYDPQDLEEILGASRSSSRWRELEARFDVEGLLLAHTSPEARAILPDVSMDPAWRLVYLDRGASFWARDHGSEAPPALDLREPRSLPEPLRVDDGLMLDAFLDAVGAREGQAANLERTLAFGRRTDLLLERLGLTQIELRRFHDAQATFGKLLGENPDSMTALNELAFLAYRVGDLDQAMIYVDRALELEPENEELLENRRRLSAALRQRTQPGEGGRP
jgi:tetratricopeptide (TPR) repeat protein